MSNYLKISLGVYLFTFYKNIYSLLETAVLVKTKMPKATCSECGSNDNVVSRAGNGKLCNDCFNKDSKTPVNEDIKEEECEPTPAKATGRGTRKSTRSTRYKPKTPATAQKQSTPAQKQSAPRGRGRRSIFKRPPLKAPTATATVVTSDSVFYEVCS